MVVKYNIALVKFGGVTSSALLDDSGNLAAYVRGDGKYVPMKDTGVDIVGVAHDVEFKEYRPDGVYVVVVNSSNPFLVFLKGDKVYSSSGVKYALQGQEILSRVGDIPPGINFRDF